MHIYIYIYATCCQYLLPVPAASTIYCTTYYSYKVPYTILPYATMYGSRYDIFILFQIFRLVSLCHSKPPAGARPTWPRARCVRASGTGDISRMSRRPWILV